MSIAAETQPRRGITGRRVLAILLGFFVAVLSVDAFMIVSALNSRPGLVVDHPYERGLAHNEVIAAEARQVALGWRISLDQADGRLSLSVRGPDGGAILPEQVTMRLIRPTDEALDRPLEPRQSPDGTWEAALGDAPAGSWEVAVTVQRGPDRMDIVQRVVIR